MHGNQHWEIFPDRFSVTGYTKVPRLAWPDANSVTPLSQVSSVGVLFSPGSVPCRTVPRSIKGAAVCSLSTSTWLGVLRMMGGKKTQPVNSFPRTVGIWTGFGQRELNVKRSFWSLAEFLFQTSPTFTKGTRRTPIWDQSRGVPWGFECHITSPEFSGGYCRETDFISALHYRFISIRNATDSKLFSWGFLCGCPLSAPGIWLETRLLSVFYHETYSQTTTIYSHSGKMHQSEGRSAATESNSILPECHVRENIYQAEYSHSVSSP